MKSVWWLTLSAVAMQKMQEHTGYNVTIIAFSVAEQGGFNSEAEAHGFIAGDSQASHAVEMVQTVSVIVHYARAWRRFSDKRREGVLDPWRDKNNNK
jgi:hypothetical protein